MSSWILFLEATFKKKLIILWNNKCLLIQVQKWTDTGSKKKQVNDFKC